MCYMLYAICYICFHFTCTGWDTVRSTLIRPTTLQKLAEQALSHHPSGLVVALIDPYQSNSRKSTFESSASSSASSVSSNSGTDTTTDTSRNTVKLAEQTLSHHPTGQVVLFNGQPIQELMDIVIPTIRNLTFLEAWKPYIQPFHLIIIQVALDDHHHTNHHSSHPHYSHTHNT